MTNNKIVISLEEILYYSLFSILLFTKGIGLDEGSGLFRACLILGMLFLAFKFLIGRYSMAEILAAGLMGIWGIATFKVTGSLGMFIYVLLIIGMKNIPVKRVFKTGAVLWGCCMLFTFTESIFAGRTGVRLVHEKMGLGPVLRESLGYTHPNVLHITYVVFMAFVLYLCKAKGKKLLQIVAFLLLGDIYVFMYSFSYTGMLISFVYLASHFYFLYRKNITKIESVLIQSILPACIVISVVLPPLLPTEGIIYKIFNGLLNNRVWAIRTAYMFYPVTLFGTSGEGIQFSIDNSYMSAMMGYGVVFLIAMAVVYWKMIRFFIKGNERAALSVTCAFLIAGLSEPFLFNASIKNITVIFVGYYLYTRKNRKENLQFLSKWNKVYEFNIEPALRIKRRLLMINKKIAGGVAAFVFGALFVFLLPKDCVKLTSVYADEKLCDVGGDTVKLTEGEEGVLYIGEVNRDNNYYYFSRENSRLIDVMDFRLKVSVSLYIAMAGGLLMCLICMGKDLLDGCGMKVEIESDERERL